jgi:exopolysaccharide biosynthesis WecB/TagA/CpsF family protein
MMRGKDIICMSSLDWGAHWTSKQQIMHRLAETNRVLYVEEPVTALAPLKVPSHWSRWKAVAPRLHKVQSGLWVLTPPPLSPFGNMYPWINQANQRVLAGYVNWAVREIGMEQLILWTYLPGSCDLIDHVRPAAVVYHCVDEHSAFPGFVRPEVVKRYDDELTRRADLVLTSAQNLLLSRQALNPHIHRIRHAADVGLFATALDPGLPIPADIASIPRPRIGVVGVHDERLDTAALEALSAADKAWQIVLVGPVVPGDVDEEHLRSLPNLHFLGGKTVAELPAYLKALDVALIPYRLNELTRNIFPLKLYEYLAAGLPVVAAALPELAPHAGSVSLAAEPAQYPALVKEALAADSPAARAARAAAVAGETWEKRVDEMSALVEEMLTRVAEAHAAADEGWGWAAPAAGRAGSPWPAVSVLGFRLDLVGLEEAAQWVVDSARGAVAGEVATSGAEPGADAAGATPPESGRTAIAVSFNPELVMRAQEDRAAAEALRNADLSYADGVGAVWAARRSAGPGSESEPSSGRVAGIDLAQRVLDLAAAAGLSVYFLGARPGVAEEAARQQKLRLPSLQIAGFRDGYFSPADEPSVVAAVRGSGAAILLAAIGAPRQETLLYRYRDQWGAGAALGIGGSFDVWAGATARAPEWVRKAGVEWLYRLARDPKRLRRQLALPRFVYRVMTAADDNSGGAPNGGGAGQAGGPGAEDPA